MVIASKVCLQSCHPYKHLFSQSPSPLHTDLEGPNKNPKVFNDINSTSTWTYDLTKLLGFQPANVNIVNLNFASFSSVFHKKKSYDSYDSYDSEPVVHHT